jgi:hypothetical protein
MVKNKAIDVSLQYLSFRNDFPEMKSTLKRKNGKSKLIVEGNIQPTPLSNNYFFRLLYENKIKPDIEIIKPKLIRNFKNEEIPHVYPGNRLCLYFPPANEWDPSKLITKYIIPWISEWLYYYEIWLSTGEWLGGGIHPKKTLNNSIINKKIKD